MVLYMCHPSIYEAEIGLSQVKRAGSLGYIASTRPCRTVHQDFVLNKRKGEEKNKKWNIYKIVIDRSTLLAVLVS